MPRGLHARRQERLIALAGIAPHERMAAFASKVVESMAVVRHFNKPAATTL
jgi:hypothetical protein